MALLFDKDGRGDRVCILNGSGSSLSEDGFSMQGDINMTGNKVINLPDPSTNSEPVTKSYADTHYSSGSGSGTKGTDTGFTMQGNINMSTNRIIGLPDPILSKEPVTVSYADYNYLPRNTDFNIGLHRIETYSDPNSDLDLINRRYADSRYVRKTMLRRPSDTTKT